MIDWLIDFNSMSAPLGLQGTEAKSGIFSYNNKWLFYKTRLISILKNKQQNKKIDTEN